MALAFNCSEVPLGVWCFRLTTGSVTAKKVEVAAESDVFDCSSELIDKSSCACHFFFYHMRGTEYLKEREV